MFVSFNFSFSVCNPLARCAIDPFFPRRAQRDLQKALQNRPKIFILIPPRNTNAQLAFPSQLRPTPIASALISPCLLYTSDAADERSSVDLGGCRIIKKK